MARHCQKAKFPKLDQRVTIQGRSQVSDSQGGYTELWTDVFECWAAVEPLSGFEKMQALQLETLVSHKITMRYHASVTSANRVVLGTRIFSIVEAINPGLQNAFLELKAYELPESFAAITWENLNLNWENLG